MADDQKNRELIKKARCYPGRSLAGHLFPVDNPYEGLDSNKQMAARQAAKKNKLLAEIRDEVARNNELLARAQDGTPSPVGERVEKTFKLEDSLGDRVTYKRAAEMLNVKVRWIRDLVRNGELQAVGRGQNKRILVQGILDRLGVQQKRK